jgi:predicted RNase H-like HicB family nuclease
MKVTAIVSRASDGDGWLAQCEEVDCAGEGPTQQEALAQLRVALEEYFGHAEAVAPPPEVPRETIEIIVVDAPAPERARRGS